VIVKRRSQDTRFGDLPILTPSAVGRMATVISPSNVGYAPPILLLSKDGGSAVRNK